MRYALVPLRCAAATRPAQHRRRRSAGRIGNPGIRRHASAGKRRTVVFAFAPVLAAPGAAVAAAPGGASGLAHRVRCPWSKHGRLNLALVGALVAVGIMAHSLGLFAEGGDYLADAAAIGGLDPGYLALQTASDPRTTPRLPESDHLGRPGQQRVAPSPGRPRQRGRDQPAGVRDWGGARLARADREQCRRAGHGGRCSHPQG